MSQEVAIEPLAVDIAGIHLFPVLHRPFRTKMLDSSQAFILHRFSGSKIIYNAVFDANFTFRDVRDTLEENISRKLREFVDNKRWTWTASAMLPCVLLTQCSKVVCTIGRAIWCKLETNNLHNIFRWNTSGPVAASHEPLGNMQNFPNVEESKRSPVKCYRGRSGGVKYYFRIIDRDTVAQMSISDVRFSRQQSAKVRLPQGVLKQALKSRITITKNLDIIDLGSCFFLLYD